MCSDENKKRCPGFSFQLAAQCVRTVKYATDVSAKSPEPSRSRVLMFRGGDKHVTALRVQACKKFAFYIYLLLLTS